MPTAGLIVVLVHGTRPRVFGRELFSPPSWTRAGSPFQTQLAARLSEKPLFVEFVWNGANTHAARLEASERLAERLRQLRTEHPASRLVVVAHSHGGNVAMYAMRQLAPAAPTTPHPIDAFTCLGTPFFRAALRDLAVVFRRVWLTVYYGVFLGIMALFMTVGPILWRVSITAARAFIVVMAAAFIAWRLGGVRMMNRWLTPERVEKLVGRARELARRVDSVPPVNGPRVLVVKSARDEAKLWLMLADRAASLVGGERRLGATSRMLFKSVKVIDWLQAHPRMVVAPVVGVLGLVLTALGSTGWNRVQLKGMIYIPIVLLIALAIVHSIVFIATSYMVRGSTVTFGQSLFLSVVAAVTTADRPPAHGVEHDVLPVTLPRDVFHHGALYMDVAVIDAVAAWMDRGSLSPDSRHVVDSPGGPAAAW